jgi:hypothetical protein
LRFRYDQGVWCCDFLDPDSKLPVGRQRRLQTADAIRTMVNRTHTPLGGPRKATFDNALENGMGELVLEVTGEQFIKLK